MSFSWDLVLSNQFFFAAKGQKILFGIVVTFGLLFILYWMLKSIGIDRSTPPSMIWHRIMSMLRSYYRPVLKRGNWKRAARFEENKKYDGAVDLYLQLFDFDGLVNSRASIAMRNELVLEHLEDICNTVGYPFPTQRISRLREDIYDYFMVKQKYRSPSDFDGSELIRAENEHRFSDKLNLSQEHALVEGFENFLGSFARKLKKHIISGAPPIVTAEQQEAAKYSLEMSVGAGPGHGAVEPAPSFAPVDPFGQGSTAPGDEIAPPADLFGTPPGQAPPAAPLTPAPGIFGGGASVEAPLPPPPDMFASGPPVAGPPGMDANPFSMDDPRLPHRDATGRIHKLPGSEDDFGYPSGPPMQEEATQMGPAPVPGPPMGGFPQPTGGFPGMGSQPPGPATPPGMGSQPPGFPQPTGGFPGFAQPQPTGGFPGFGSQPPGPSTPPPPGGGFPGMGSQPPPSQPPGFPQPTGGFPGFGSQPPGPSTPPPGGGFPQPTGGFPGFSSQPPPGSGFPQPTGGFPGFGSNPPDDEKK